MISIFQDIIWRIAVFVSSIAISLGILTSPAVIPSSQQPATIVSITETEQIVATQEGKPILIVATPTATSTPTPQVSPCEAQIKTILPEVEEAYLAQLKIKEEIMKIEVCHFNNRPTWMPTPSEEEIKDCEQHNQNVISQGDERIRAKMGEYKVKLTACAGQDVKFSKYSSKIPSE